MAFIAGERRAYDSVSHHASDRWRHIYAIPNNEIGRDHRDFVVHPGPLSPILLSNNPNVGRLVSEARVGLCCCLQGIVCDNEFKSRHSLKASLEGLTCLDKMAESFVVAGLNGERGIVGGWVKERGFGKVEKN